MTQSRRQWSKGQDTCGTVFAWEILSWTHDNFIHVSMITTSQCGQLAFSNEGAFYCSALKVGLIMGNSFDEENVELDVCSGVHFQG